MGREFSILGFFCAIPNNFVESQVAFRVNGKLLFDILGQQTPAGFQTIVPKSWRVFQKARSRNSWMGSRRSQPQPPEMGHGLRLETTIRTRAGDQDDVSSQANSFKLLNRNIPLFVAPWALRDFHYAKKTPLDRWSILVARRTHSDQKSSFCKPQKHVFGILSQNTSRTTKCSGRPWHIFVCHPKEVLNETIIRNVEMMN